MKDKRTNVLIKIADFCAVHRSIILVIVGLLLFFTFIVNITTINAFAAGPGVTGDTSGGFGSDDYTTNTTYEPFAPPQIPPYEDFVQYFGLPLVFNGNPQVIDFFVDPSFEIDALLYTNEQGYIVTNISYVTDISGLSYYFDIEYIGSPDFETATITFNSADNFLLYVFLDEDIVFTPDITLMFDTYFIDMSLGEYIGFGRYFEQFAIPQFEQYYNTILNKLGSEQFGQNMLLSIITAPYDVLDSLLFSKQME